MAGGSSNFASIALMGTNKAGKLKPDAKGYYTVVLGGFETKNLHGDEYPLTAQAERLFHSSSQFMRQIEEGNLYGELGHPKRLPGESMMQFIKKCMLVNEDRCCMHIRRIYLDKENVKDKNGKTIVAVIGEIRPQGQLGHVLKDILDNPDSNCCFSVRANTDDEKLPNGRERRSVKQIVTFDFVNDPGVVTSTKYKSPKLENADNNSFDCVADVFNLEVDNTVLRKLREECRNPQGSFKTESAGRIDSMIDVLLGKDYSQSRSVPSSRLW